MEGIAEVMDKSDLVPGIDYQVLTISFDPREPLTWEYTKRKIISTL
jgi:protein SCO1/2